MHRAWRGRNDHLMISRQRRVFQRLAICIGCAVFDLAGRVFIGRPSYSEQIAVSGELGIQDAWSLDEIRRNNDGLER